MHKRKVLIINSNYQYDNLFLSFGMLLTEQLSEADLVCFTGGEDVSPTLYGARSHPRTGAFYPRDEYEMDVFNHCKAAGIPMCGICRGGQFLNCMNGGIMYQHVTRHTLDHYIIDATTNEVVLATSTHHQMMKPGLNAVLVASSTMRGSREWYEGESYHEDVSDLDIEVLYYPETNCLCFQPHPEFGSAHLQGYFLELLTRYNLLT